MNNQVIAFHYTLTNAAGETLDSSSGNEPLSFVTGAGHIIPGLETHLTTMDTGDKKRVTVAAKDAYGEHEPARIFEVPRERVGDVTMKVGDRFKLGNGQQVMIVTVTKLTDSHVTLDGNHPLAGQDLTFDVEVMSKREAKPEDLNCCGGAHQHGDCGHDHDDGCCGKHQH